MLSVLLLATSAQASTMNDGPMGWPTTYQRSLSTFRAGASVYSIGLGVGSIGGLLGSYELALAGGLAELAGPPIMAGASLRARRAVNEMGGQVSPAGGILGWTFWGVGLGVGVVDGADGDPSLPGVLVRIGCELGSVISSSVQVSAARRQYGGAREIPEPDDTDLPEASTPRDRSPVTVVAAPFVVSSGGGAVVHLEF